MQVPVFQSSIFLIITLISGFHHFIDSTLLSVCFTNDRPRYVEYSMIQEHDLLFIYNEEIILLNQDESCLALAMDHETSYIPYRPIHRPVLYRDYLIYKIGDNSILIYDLINNSWETESVDGIIQHYLADDSLFIITENGSNVVIYTYDESMHQIQTASLPFQSGINYYNTIASGSSLLALHDNTLNLVSIYPNGEVDILNLSQYIATTHFEVRPRLFYNTCNEYITAHANSTAVLLKNNEVHYEYVNHVDNINLQTGGFINLGELLYVVRDDNLEVFNLSNGETYTYPVDWSGNIRYTYSLNDDIVAFISNSGIEYFNPASHEFRSIEFLDQQEITNMYVYNQGLLLIAANYNVIYVPPNLFCE